MSGQLVELKRSVATTMFIVESGLSDPHDGTIRRCRADDDAQPLESALPDSVQRARARAEGE